MADPGFLPGLIGAAVAEILHAVIVAAGKAILWRKHLKVLEQLLRPLEPMVKDIAAQELQDQLSSSVREWLEIFYKSLREAEQVILKCSNVKALDVIARYQAATQLQAATARINDLVHQVPVPVLAVVMQQAASMDQSLKDLADELRRVQVGMVTQNWMMSEMLHKDRAFYEINSVAASSGTNSMQQPSPGLLQPDVDDESSLQLQPVPEFVFGVEEMTKTLQDLILEKSRDESKKPSKWVGIWGTGGVGKTLLAKMLLNSLDCQAHFTGNIYFLIVGRSPNVVALQGKLCEVIGLGRKIFDSKDDGKTRLFNYLRGKRSLLVLDDVWEPDLLDWLDVVTEAGSKILVTTRNQPVLQRVNAIEVRVNMLSEENSWRLFCRHAFHGEENVPLEIKDVVKQVVAECKGLPLALKVTGAAMLGKREIYQWTSDLSKLRNCVLLGEQEAQLYQRLKLSYDALEQIDASGGKAIQECFLYFAAFPEDKEVEVEQLFEVWLGEKIIGGHDEDDDIDDPEGEAYYLIGLLIARSLIELGDSKIWSHARSGHTFSCKIHDVLRDLAFYILQHNKQTSEQECLFRAGKLDECKSFPGDWKKSGSTKDLSARKVSLIGSSIQCLPRLTIRAPAVSVLLLSHNASLTKINNGFLRNFRNLKVLDLSHTHIDSLPQDVGKLRQLVVLNLSHCSPMKSVPASITKLTRLENLNLQQCQGLTSFPVTGLSKLTNLKYFNARGCGQLWDLNNIKGTTSCLLYCTAAATRTQPSPSSPLDSLGSLIRLRKLWISSLSQDSLPSTSLSKLVKLRSLSLYFQKLKALPDDLQCLVELQVLDLNTCVELQSLPSWVQDSFLQLRFLDLRFCTRLSQLPDLNKLERLTKLDLSACQSLTHLPQSFFCSGAFPALQELWLMSCVKLEELPEVQTGAAPRLLLLSLLDCSSLRRLPQSDALEPVLSSLRKLELGGCTALQLPLVAAALACFTHLEELSMKNTLIPQIPPSVVSLPSLKKLDVSGCRYLNSIPGDEGTCYFRSLEQLLAKETPINELPMALAGLPHLRKLDITGCPVSSLDNEELREAFRSRSTPVQIEGIIM